MFNKNILALTALILLLSGSLVFGDTHRVLSIPGPEDTTNDTTYVEPDVDDKVDLGTSTKEFRNGYFDGTVYADILSVDAITLGGAITGDVAITGDIRITSGLFGATAQNVTISTDNAITPTSSYVVICTTSGAGLNGAITLSQTPPIVATNFVAGDYLLITTTSTYDGIILTEGSAYDLQLGASTRTIKQFDTLLLIYCSSSTVAGSGWFQEVSFVDN